MSTPPSAHRSFFARIALIALVVAVPLACTSSRAGISATTTVATTSTSSSTSSTSSTSTSTTTTTTLPPTTTTMPLVTAGGVVKVANASGINGAARQLTDSLAALGFVTRDATNAAAVDEDLDTSKIYVIAGAEAVAESISYLMGGIPIERMPTPAWISGGTANLGDANVLVMLGHDLAGTPLADMRT
ncbi:MAG: LytR C-terminal domain-containing protein [Actinomycetota bacterium]|nr:LytR C-terminal domain-containing protein [Actinomycetota bacterium]